MLRLSKSGRLAVLSTRRNRARERLLTKIVQILLGNPNLQVILGERLANATKLSLRLTSVEREVLGLEIGRELEPRALVQLAKAFGAKGELRGSGYVLSESSNEHVDMPTNRLFMFLEGKMVLEGRFGLMRGEYE